jgi:uncharacterized protein (DUF924 family)
MGREGLPFATSILGETMDQRAGAVLDFWFSDRVIANELWFKSDPVFDRAIHEQFGADAKRAAEGHYDGWLGDAESVLALLILLDQFPRNIFRGTARAFASDKKAQEAASIAISRGFDQQVPPQRRLFFYLPFEHAEDLALQERSVALIAPLAGAIPDVAVYAERHRALIREFGRFPHRNKMLGRESTPAEVEYLAKTPNEFG